MSVELPPELKGLEKLVSPEKEKRHIWIQVMGVTGAGKTTLAKLIKEHLKFELAEEQFTNNPFFEDYYKDPAKYALPAQIWFLDEKYRQIQGSDVGGFPGIRSFLRENPVVSEPPIWEDRLYAQARLENYPKQWEIYNRYYEGLVLQKEFPQPDFIAYAFVSFPNMLKRIKLRAEKEPEVRKIELEASVSYWKRLWELHEEWVKDNSLRLRIFKIDTNRWDFSFEKNDIGAQNAVAKEVLTWLRYYLVDKKTQNTEIIIPEVIQNYHPPITRIFDKAPRSVKPQER